MNYDFLQSYNIPILRHRANNQYPERTNNSDGEASYGTYSMISNEGTSGVNNAYYGYGGSNTYGDRYSLSARNSVEYYQNPERFLPPSKHGTAYMPQKSGFKRKNNAAIGGGAAKKEAPISEVCGDGKLAMFLGRDESYPDELNSLIHPLSCDLCNVKMNSRMLAKDHYESKAHDKHISAWLFKNYTEKGVDPPSVKRFIKKGPTGPDAYYCEVCDLKLTSLTHASQHYDGKKHRLVIAQRAKPSGAGFYNSEGKWVRTGKKVTPNPTNDNRFKIGSAFKLDEVPTSIGNVNASENSSADTETIKSVADTTVASVDEVKPTGGNTLKNSTLNPNIEQDPALYCSICNISVTSAVQMTTHMSGSKHMKKLKLAGLNSSPIQNNIEAKMDVAASATVMDNVLLSAVAEEITPDPNDLSMYRTPSGQYYCKTCNTSMSHLPGLVQHLKGKRHMKKLTEEKAKASLAAKKN